jgi:hypothetical protein
MFSFETFGGEILQFFAPHRFRQVNQVFRSRPTV